MTISDNYSPDVSLGNGVTTVFTGSWSPQVAVAMVVELVDQTTGDRVTQTQGVDYSLTFTDAGYTVTFLIAPPPSGQDVVRSREIPLTQNNPYTTAQGFEGDVIEDSLDKLTAITQDLGDNESRTPKFATGSSTSDITFPEPVPSFFIRWNAAGTDLEAVSGSGITIPDGDKGDITTSSSGTVWTINDDAITTPKLADNAVTDPKLADVESGSWTPEITFFIPGDLSITYAIQTGYYTRRGNLWTLSFNMLTSSFTHTTASNFVRITGLPVTAANNTNGNWYGTMAFAGVTKAGYTQFTPRLIANSNTMDISASGSGQSAADITAADMPSGTTQFIAGSITIQGA